METRRIRSREAIGTCVRGREGFQRLEIDFDGVFYFLD